MTSAAWSFVCSIIIIVVIDQSRCVPPSRYHGRIKMGVSNKRCDNASWRLWVDWDNSTNFDYRCQPDEMLIVTNKTEPVKSCLKNKEIPLPIHKCMTQRIVYKDQPPRGGAHRPLWPVYGEYQYLPPQRWIHSMEHGGVVFLYHPCADPVQISSLQKIARSCLRRHVITPYRQLPMNQPLAMLTYGCKLMMSHVDVDIAKKFIKENAKNKKRAPEPFVWHQGQYKFGLIQKAAIVTNIRDARLCPDNNSRQYRRLKKTVV